jgi:hypothetical protein
MIQDGDGNCEHMVEQLRLQVGEAAEVLGRKKVSLSGAIYLSNGAVIMPSALCRLELSSATGEKQIDRIQSPLRKAIAKKAHTTATRTDVLYGGYMGCGWKQWRDEAGIERLRIVLQMAWQKRGSVFAKVMRGAVWQLQQDSGASDLVLAGVPVCWG